MPVEIHSDLFLAASLVGDTMQSMVTTVSRKTGLIVHKLFNIPNVSVFMLLLLLFCKSLLPWNFFTIGVGCHFLASILFISGLFVLFYFSSPEKVQ